jgi:hypothetical protein
MDDIGNAGEYNGGYGSPYFLSGLRLPLKNGPDIFNSLACCFFD